MDEWKGLHNTKLNSPARIAKEGFYKDLSTICIIPAIDAIPARVVQSWLALIHPMNQKYFPIFMIGMEVGAAYTQAIEMVLEHPEFKKWKYILTIESDNMPPPDGLLKLYESIEGGVDGKKYDVVGSIYWTKGEGGQPMIYGDPEVMPRNFIPQIPKFDAVQPANGLGMGFNLYRISMFKDKKFKKPWFKTCQEYEPGKGVKMYTQDLYFYEKAGSLGYKFACDTRVKTGHYDVQNNIIW